MTAPAEPLTQGATPGRASPCCGARISSALADGVLAGYCDACNGKVVWLDTRTGIECGPAAKPPTLDRLLRAVARLAQTGLDLGDPPPSNHVEIEDRALERVQAEFTPPTRAALIEELARGLGAVEVTLNLRGHVDQVIALGGEPQISIFRPGELRPEAMAIEGARAVRGIVELRAQRHGRPATPEEEAHLTGAEPGRRVVRVRAEAGVIVPELLIAIGGLAAVLLLIGSILARSPWGLVAVVPIILAVLALVSARAKPVEVPSVPPSVQARLCATAPGHGPPVDVTPRQRKGGGIPLRQLRAIQAHRHEAPRRAERGSARGSILSAVACAAITAVVLLLGVGCSESPAPRPAPDLAMDESPRGICKGEALRRIAVEVGVALAAVGRARAEGALPDADRQIALERLRQEFARIEREGCGL